MTTQEQRDRLDDANSTLGQELALIRLALTAYSSLGLNAASTPKKAKPFLGLAQMLALRAVAIGLTKIFERSSRHDLCSITGVWTLAKALTPLYREPLNDFVLFCGTSPTADCLADVSSALANRADWLKSRLKLFTHVRDKRLAHLEQADITPILPSIATMEELVDFGVRFHDMVNRGFLSVTTVHLGDVTQLRRSMFVVLRAVGVPDPKHDFDD